MFFAYIYVHANARTYRKNLTHFHIKVYVHVHALIKYTYMYFNQPFTCTKKYRKTYHIAGNFQGVQLSWFSQMIA